MIEAIYRAERARILATLIGLLHDFDLAEEMMQEAFAAALVQWKEHGIPENPRAWIVSTARFKAIDAIRRLAKFRDLAPAPEAEFPSPDPEPDSMITDDRLRLIFTCCHPALPLEAQVALTLRTLCGLTTEEIARSFLVPASTMAQRIVRAKKKIFDARIPYRIPPDDLLTERLDAVLATVYLIFTEGHAATSGNELLRRDLCSEAIRLARVLVELMPAQTEPKALLALMLLHYSRRDTRTDGHGDLVLLEAQDRSLWHRAEIAEGSALLKEILRTGRATSRYALQAAIAAVHAEAKVAADTDWHQIAGLYQFLMRLAPSPVVALNRAVAVAMAEGPASGLELLDALEAEGSLSAYHLLPAARADFLRRLGRTDEAVQFYARALALAGNEPERRYLTARVKEFRPGQ